MCSGICKQNNKHLFNVQVKQYSTILAGIIPSGTVGPPQMSVFSRGGCVSWQLLLPPYRLPPLIKGIVPVSMWVGFREGSLGFRLGTGFWGVSRLGDDVSTKGQEFLSQGNDGSDQWNGFQSNPRFDMLMLSTQPLPEIGSSASSLETGELGPDNMLCADVESNGPMSVFANNVVGISEACTVGFVSSESFGVLVSKSSWFSESIGLSSVLVGSITGSL